MPPKRWATYYEMIRHDNCQDPEHCDCECPGCLRAKLRAAAAAEHAAHDPTTGPCPCPRVACTLARMPIVELTADERTAMELDD